MTPAGSCWDPPGSPVPEPRPRATGSRDPPARSDSRTPPAGGPDGLGTCPLGVPRPFRPRPKGWSHLPAGRGCGFPGRRRGLPARGIRPAPKPGTGHASPADGGGHLRARRRITRPGGTPAACRCPPPLLRMAGHRVCSTLIGDPSRTGRQFPGAVGNWLRDVRGALRIVHAPRHLHKVGRRSAAEPAPRQCCPALPKALFTIPRKAAPLDPVPTPFCAPRGTGGRACPGEWRVVCRYGHELLWTDAAGRASCSRGSRKPPRRGCGPAGRRRAQRPHRLRHRTRAAFEGVPRYDPDIPEAAAFGTVTHGTARRGLPGRIGLRISVVETGKGRLPCRA